MTQIPSGWYPDPDPDAPEPKGQRYWDGQQWTEHLQPAPGSAPPAPYGTAPGAPGGYASYPAGGYAGAQTGRVTTPDGQEVAGWGRRLAAYLLDSIVINLASWVVAFPAARDYFAAVNEMTDEITSGGAGSGGFAGLTEEMARPLLVIGLVSLGISLVYTLVFLRWRAATPGKMALGLAVRLRETPGQLSYGTILARWFGQNLNSAIGYLPIFGPFLGAIYWLLDHLWPLWDPRNQAVHDKIAKTNVVKK